VLAVITILVGALQAAAGAQELVVLAVLSRHSRQTHDPRPI
jgi:hypothetical protein